MEALSPTMEEGRLVEWKKGEGDPVAVRGREPQQSGLPVGGGGLSGQRGGQGREEREEQGTAAAAHRGEHTPPRSDALRPRRARAAR